MIEELCSEMKLTGFLHLDKEMYLEKIENILKSLKEKPYYAKAIHFLTKNYSFAKAYFYIGFSLNFRDKQPLLIYQMGKVGSTTILESLKTLRVSFAIFHVHVLSRNGIAFEEKLYYGENSGIRFKSNLPRMKHLFQSYYLHKRITKTLNGKKWKIITLIRDPIARNVSVFFQIIDLRIPGFYNLFARKAIKIEDLKELFLRDFEGGFEPDIMPFKWFERELYSTFGIDVLSREFPKDRGYKIYESKNADVLLIKLENLNKCSKDAFKEFLNLREFNLMTANVAKNKKYYPIYQEFIDSLVLPASYLDKMYACKFMQHFYSKEEIIGFRKRWLK